MKYKYEDIPEPNLEPPCEDGFVECDNCHKKVDYDDTYDITDDVLFCKRCFDYALTKDSSLLLEYIDTPDQDLLEWVLKRLKELQKK